MTRNVECLIFIKLFFQSFVKQKLNLYSVPRGLFTSILLFKMRKYILRILYEMSVSSKIQIKSTLSSSCFEQCGFEL